MFLSKASLAALPVVAADLYFSNTANWNKVVVYYKSAVGNQKEIVEFDATQASPAADFLVSDKARDNFEVQKIVIQDFDNGNFQILRELLTVAEFDITFNIPSTYIVWDITNGPTTNATGAVFPDPNPANTEWWRMAKSSTGYAGDFELAFEFIGSSEGSLGLAVGMSSGTQIGDGGSNGFLGGYSIMNRFGDGLLEKVDSSGNFVPGQYPINASGNNIVKFKRVGSSVDILVNGSVVFTYSQSGTLYPLCRPYTGTLTTSYSI